MADEYIRRAEALEITTRTCGDYAAALYSGIEMAMDTSGLSAFECSQTMGNHSQRRKSFKCGIVRLADGSFGGR